MQKDNTKIQTPEYLFELFDRPIAFHPVLGRICGSITAGLMLSQAIYWQRRCPKGRGGWWWKTQEDWEHETGMSRKEQEGARRKLRELGVLEEKKQGIPARMHYRVNLTILAENVVKNQQIAQKGQTRMPKRSNPVCTNGANSDAQNGQSISETSPDISPLTTPTTHLRARTRDAAGPADCGGLVGGLESDSDSFQNQKSKPGGEEGGEEEYLNLGVRYGGRDGGHVVNPPAWRRATQARLQRQGGLNDDDRAQRDGWKLKEKKDRGEISRFGDFSTGFHGFRIDVG